MADREVVDALRAELEGGESELADALSGIAAADAEPSVVAGHIERYAEYLRRFANAADMFDLSAIKELAGFFESNAIALADASPEDRGHVERHEVLGLLGDEGGQSIIVRLGGGSAAHLGGSISSVRRA